MKFLHPEFFFLIPVALILAGLVWVGRTRSAVWQKQWGLVSSHRPWISALLLGLSFLCIVSALARPVWNPVPINRSESGQEAVFVIDVSRSMETTDIAGVSRIAALKQALNDLIPDLEGDAVALVAFAGTAVIKSPLTTDLDFFRESVRLLDTGATSRGGTLLGDALRQVKKDFVKPGRSTALWVFTDGGDQESFPVEAAREIGQAGGRLYLWGVGSMGGGAVPGREVSSALNEPLLQQVAQAVPGGAFFGSSFPLWQLNREYAAKRQLSRTVESSRVVWQEGSWWLLWPAGLLLLLELCLQRFSLRGRTR